MGIVNVTPDSFSDGGMFMDEGAAIAHAVALVGAGAAIVDVGGESTRPGAEPVAAERELARVTPVIAGLAGAGTGAQISIDTSKIEVAEAALGAGATMVNDVSAFRAEPLLAGLVADRGADCCLMHMLGEPRTMQEQPRYGDVVDDVKAFLEARLEFAVGEGVRERHIWLDPGIGFGKSAAHNLELLRRLGELRALGRPLLIGTSRKSFLGTVAGAGRPGPPLGVLERLPGTIATCVMALERGASVFRVHDVREVRDALAVAAATLTAGWTPPSTPTTPTI
jgi:dihydropteroate synthase